MKVLLAPGCLLSGMSMTGHEREISSVFSVFPFFLLHLSFVSCTAPMTASRSFARRNSSWFQMMSRQAAQLAKLESFCCWCFGKKYLPRWETGARKGFFGLHVRILTVLLLVSSLVPFCVFLFRPEPSPQTSATTPQTSATASEGGQSAMSRCYAFVRKGRTFESEYCVPSFVQAAKRRSLSILGFLFFFLPPHSLSFRLFASLFASTLRSTSSSARSSSN